MPLVYFGGNLSSTFYIKKVEKTSGDDDPQTKQTSGHFLLLKSIFINSAPSLRAATSDATHHINLSWLLPRSYMLGAFITQTISVPLCSTVSFN